MLLSYSIKCIKYILGCLTYWKASHLRNAFQHQCLNEWQFVLLNVLYYCTTPHFTESCAVQSAPASSFELLPSSFVSVFWQNEMPKVMRQGMDEMLQFEKKTEEKTRVYTYAKAVERCFIIPLLGHWYLVTLSLLTSCWLKCFISSRLLAANPSLSVQSVRMLLERGLVQVEGGTSLSASSE